MYTLFIFILGLLIGSFLNVCIYRIPRGESIAFPPSHCMNCGAQIKPYDLIPILSYLLLKGSCRNCGQQISVQYPLIELITGALFAALYIKFGLTFELFKFMIFICFSIVIGIIDLETTDVYFKTTCLGIISGLFMIGLNCYFGNEQEWMTFLWGGLLGGGVISIIILITHGMGWGDAEICILGGIFLGFRLTVVMLFLSFIIGGIVGIFLMITKKKSRKDYIPFGPFLSLGSILSLFFGQELIYLYLSQLYK